MKMARLFKARKPINFESRKSLLVVWHLFKGIHAKLIILKTLLIYSDKQGYQKIITIMNDIMIQ